MTKTDMHILARRLQLLELKVKELETVEPKAIEQRLDIIENKLYVMKEMLTTDELADYLGISVSLVYKFTSSFEIPHYKPRGKMIYFDRKEVVRWMRRNHVKAVYKVEDDSDLEFEFEEEETEEPKVSEETKETKETENTDGQKEQD